MSVFCCHHAFFFLANAKRGIFFVCMTLDVAFVDVAKVLGSNRHLTLKSLTLSNEAGEPPLALPKQVQNTPATFRSGGDNDFLKLALQQFGGRYKQHWYEFQEVPPESSARKETLSPRSATRTAPKLSTEKSSSPSRFHASHTQILSTRAQNVVTSVLNELESKTVGLASLAPIRSPRRIDQGFTRSPRCEKMTPAGSLPTLVLWSKHPFVMRMPKNSSHRKWRDVISRDIHRDGSPHIVESVIEEYRRRDNVQ